MLYMEYIIFKDSAFRHGYGKKDYKEVIRNRKLVLRSRRGYRNVYEILGRNDAGDYLHLITRRFRKGRERVVIVFHIGRMNAADRKRFIKIMEK